MGATLFRCGTSPSLIGSARFGAGVWAMRPLEAMIVEAAIAMRRRRLGIDIVGSLSITVWLTPDTTYCARADDRNVRLQPDQPVTARRVPSAASRCARTPVAVHRRGRDRRRPSPCRRVYGLACLSHPGALRPSPAL